MKPSSQIAPKIKILGVSFLVSFLVLAASLVIQWLVYDDWLHRTGPLRVVGTSIAGVVTFVFMLRWQYAVREQERRMIRQFQLISRMNDRIRNALQAIECVTYLSEPDAASSVRREVDAIDQVLREVFADVDHPTYSPRGCENIEEEEASRQSA